MLLCRILDTLLISSDWRQQMQEFWGRKAEYDGGILSAQTLAPDLVSTTRFMHISALPQSSWCQGQAQKGDRDFNISLELSLVGPEPELVSTRLDSAQCRKDRGSPSSVPTTSMRKHFPFDQADLKL